MRSDKRGKKTIASKRLARVPDAGRQAVLRELCHAAERVGEARGAVPHILWRAGGERDACSRPRDRRCASRIGLPSPPMRARRVRVRAAWSRAGRMLCPDVRAAMGGGRGRVDASMLRPVRSCASVCLVR
jgi:hypothetical protein